jgi:chromosome segregation ATPase
MAEENVGFFKSLWRLITFWKSRRAMGLVRSADEQFTGSVEGISDAFDLQQNKLVTQYRELRDAIASVETIIEQRRSRLDALNKEEEELIQKREGALAKAEEAEAMGDTTALERHTAAFERFENRIQEIEAQQAALEGEIKGSSQTMEKYMLQLTSMQSEIEKLPQQKAQAMADFISSRKIIELNERLSGIQTSIDRGPIEAVLKANKDLSARARITEKLAGTDSRIQDMEYAQAGRGSSARDKMKQMLAARKAERQGQTEEEAAKDNRPEI